MRAKAQQQDLFLQYKYFETTLDGTASDTLVKDEQSTGLSIRGEYAWLIWELAWMFEVAIAQKATDEVLKAALSVEEGAADTPQLKDKGVISAFRYYQAINTQGALYHIMPWIEKKDPPVVIASPKLTLYAQTVADEATWRSKELMLRVGYTTIPMEQKLYLEIAEMWESL